MMDGYFFVFFKITTKKNEQKKLMLVTGEDLLSHFMMGLIDYMNVVFKIRDHRV